MAILYGYDFFPDQRITGKLSMAVFLVDDYTGNQPIGGVKVFLEGQDLKSVKNPSGYYLFLDLPGTKYRIRVISDHYFAETIPVKLSDLVTGQPVVDIRLKPKPSYPFPSGATLIRGMVRDINNSPVSRARVEILTKGVDNKTTGRGEFVLYLKGLKEEDLIDGIFIKGNNGKTVHLKVTHETKSCLFDLEEVKEGQTTSVKEPIILS